jgi:hypothetical protein
MHSRQPFHTETRRHHQCTGFKTDQFFAEKRIITCKVYHAKVLKGVGNNHSLPDYAHTKSSIYIKENTNGSFREMRIYDPDDGHVVLEILRRFSMGKHSGRWKKTLYGLKKDLPSRSKKQKTNSVLNPP